MATSQLISSEAVLFTPNYKLSDVVEKKVFSCKPDYFTENNGQIIFLVPPSSEHFTSLDMKLKMTLRVKRTLKTNMAAGDKVAPRNYILYTAFKSLMLQINNKTVVNIPDNWAQFAHFWLSFNTTAAYRDNILSQTTLYSEDATGEFDSTQNNPGFDNRADMVTTSNPIYLEGYLPLDICVSNRWLPPGCSLALTLQHARDEERLQIAANTPAGRTFVVQLEDVKLELTRIVPTAALMSSIQNSFAAEKKAVYPFKRLLMTGPNPVPNDTMAYNLTMPYTIKPSCMFVWFQEASRVVQNDFKKNSQRYSNPKVSYCRCQFEGEIFPRSDSNGYELDMSSSYNNAKATDLYAALFDLLGYTGDMMVAPGVNFKRFFNDQTVFTFNLESSPMRPDYTMPSHRYFSKNPVFSFPKFIFYFSVAELNYTFVSPIKRPVTY